VSTPPPLVYLYFDKKKLNFCFNFNLINFLNKNMSFSGVVRSSRDVLHVQGIPMSEELRVAFIANAVNPTGFLRNSVLYQELMNEIVLPMHRYHWLTENLEERIALYRLLVGYLVNKTEAKSTLGEEFDMNIDLLRPRERLENYLNCQRELLLFFPSVSRGKIIYEGLIFDSENYRYFFPNTNFRQMSSLLRGTSWIVPCQWGQL
jgi:hypothetical protein